MIRIDFSRGRKNKKQSMFGRLPKKYREKYAKPRSWDEELIIFAAKVVSSTVLLLLVAGGIDVYRLLH